MERLFHPDPSKQVIEICFAHKHDNDNHPSLELNNSNIQLATNQKYLGLI